MFIIAPEKLTRQEKRKTVDRLIKESAMTFDFLLMLIMSTVIVALGLLLNNIAIIIGGMLVAPMLFPVLSFGMGMVSGEPKLIRRSGLVIVQSMAVVIVVSFSIASLAVDKTLTSEIIARGHVNLSYFLVAFVSGLAVSYVLTRKEVSEVIPGVAISVALLPPLSATGLALGFLNWQVVFGSLGLFGANLLGIILASLFVFSLTRFYEVKDSVRRNIKVEETTIKRKEVEKKKQNLNLLAKEVKQAVNVIKKEKKTLKRL